MATAFASLRPKTIRRADLLKAIQRGKAVAEEWRSEIGGTEWQAEAIEILLLPGLWARMLRKMEWDGHYASYQPIRRVHGYGRTGYVLPGWNGEPCEGREYSHSPGTCWDGIRRELYSSLADLLRTAAYGHNVTAELRDRWNIRLA